MVNGEWLPLDPREKCRCRGKISVICDAICAICGKKVNRPDSYRVTERTRADSYRLPPFGFAQGPADAVRR